MKKLIPVLLVVVALAAIVSRRRTSPEERKAKMARRMRAKIESMPDDFPPRMMHDNLAATRENTERILSILESSGPAG